MESPEYILGIDEAGRGPVLGPMVYACAIWQKDKEEEIIKNYNFNDSKKLTDKIRRVQFEKMKTDPNIKYYVKICHPVDISGQMLRRDENIINLNEQAYIAAVSLINDALKDELNITNVIADAVGPEMTYIRAMTEKCIKKSGIEFKAEKKADANHKVVSAASIVAKVTRDLIIEEWKFIENNKDIEFSTELGSGYPADPNTKLWLENNFNEIFGFPSIVRFSWQTAKEYIYNKAFKTTYQDYEDIPDGDKRQKFNEHLIYKKVKKIPKDYLKKKDINMFNSNKALFSFSELN